MNYGRFQCARDVDGEVEAWSECWYNYFFGFFFFENLVDAKQFCCGLRNVELST